jgi:hypothetical protein
LSLVNRLLQNFLQLRHLIKSCTYATTKDTAKTSNSHFRCLSIYQQLKLLFCG